MKPRTDRRGAVTVPGRSAVTVPGRDAVAIPATSVLHRAVTARRSDGPANCRNNKGETGFLLFAAHVTMP